MLRLAQRQGIRRVGVEGQEVVPVSERLMGGLCRPTGVQRYRAGWVSILRLGIALTMRDHLYGALRNMRRTTLPSLRHLYTGKERDAESGNDYFGARYYGSSMGRFMSPDDFTKDTHVADPQSWNLYAYARNNPLRYTDPTGQTATESTSCTTDSSGHQTCNVSIAASIAIYARSGSGLTQSQLNSAASTIQSSINNAWSGYFTRDDTSCQGLTPIALVKTGHKKFEASFATSAKEIFQTFTFRRVNTLPTGLCGQAMQFCNLKAAYSFPNEVVTKREFGTKSVPQRSPMISFTIC